jgi:CheY-like chemotaxis protein/anti-sigma regulatory factor (Ser/Thr protein kinase)
VSLHLPPDSHARHARPALRILVAEDELSTRLLVRAMLRAVGHVVLEAADGAAAVRCFEREQPDVVLLDNEMPVMDGVEACGRIKALAGERYVPVIFVTAASDEAIARGIEAGGDGFLTKPFSSRTLLATIEAARRTQLLHATVREQACGLAAHQERQRRERLLAARLFDRIMAQGDLEAPNLRYLLLPASDFGGDLVLAAHTPSGRQRLLVGDFTGHGLPSALGAIPTSEVFYARTAAGHDLPTIVREINARLRRVLVPGNFLAAAVAEYDPRDGRLSVWNAGLPDVFVTHPGAGIVHRFVSRHLPLAILEEDQLDLGPESITVGRGDRAYFYTDGIVEAVNAAGERFGYERLEALLAADTTNEYRLPALHGAVARFRGVAAQHDDEAIIELACEPAAAVVAAPVRSGEPASDAPSRVLVELEAAALRHADLLPLLSQLLDGLPALEGNRAVVQLVLGELVANAIQHGVFGLSSERKDTPEGFDAFYRDLAEARARAGEGWVRVELAHRLADGRHRLEVRVSDSGLGFEPPPPPSDTEARPRTAGRGLELVRTLSERLAFERGGSMVVATLAWDATAHATADDVSESAA